MKSIFGVFNKSFSYLIKLTCFDSRIYRIIFFIIEKKKRDQSFIKLTANVIDDSLFHFQFIEWNILN